MKSTNRTCWLIALVAGVACSSLLCCTAARITARRASSEPLAITHNDIERTFYLHIPPSYDATKPMPLVIAMHGGGGTATGMQELTQDLDELADVEHFIVVYPNGVDKHWNDGREIYSDTNVDDVGFINTLIDHVSEKYNIETNRIYATGISNGGLMSFRLACELPTKVAAIAPVTAALSEDLYASCSPTQPISVLIVNGTDDPLVPWNGGEITLGRQKRGQVLSTPDTVAFWVAQNHCETSPTISQEQDSAPEDGTQVRREIYAQCDGGTAVALYMVEGGGHTWPGGWQYLPESIIGKTSQDIDANKVIWHFFEEYARR